MTRRFRFVLLLILVNLVFLAPGLAVADKCAEHVPTTCIGCHNTDEICVRLGNSEKEWKAIILWMIDNGAELEDDEVEPLVKCFSTPSAGAKSACNK